MRVYKNVENIGLMTIVFIFCLEIITTTRLLINGSVWGGDCFIAMIMSMVVCYWVSDNMKHIVLTTVICIFIFMAGTYICGHLYSIDWDGNAYHKMAIGCLKNGWNPIYESAQSFVNGYFNDSKIDSCAIWIDHYGKASWIFAANIYALTGKIECGKVYQLLAMESLFCMAAPYMIRKGIKKWTAVMVSILLVVNPVSFVQIFSYYVDGFLFSYLFILILGLTRLLDAENREQRKITWLVIVCSMSVLANIKFTGLLYGGIYCVAYQPRLRQQRAVRLFLRDVLAHVRAYQPVPHVLQPAAHPAAGRLLHLRHPSAGEVPAEVLPDPAVCLPDLHDRHGGSALRVPLQPVLVVSGRDGRQPVRPHVPAVLLLRASRVLQGSHR